jgi:hypothetical protein
MHCLHNGERNPDPAHQVTPAVFQASVPAFGNIDANHQRVHLAVNRAD